MTIETTLSYTEEEGMHFLPDGKGLYMKMWKPKSNPPRAVLAFFHGFSDHCNAYYEFFPTLADRGIEVRAVDQRGWGRSVTKPSERGLTGPTTLVLADMHSFLLSLCPPKVPLFVMGHSMGGGQLLTYLFHPESPFNNNNNNQSRPTLSGAMIYSPLIALHPSTRPSMLKVTLGRMAAKLLPRWQLYSPVDANLVSRDPQVCMDYATDELCHDTGTLEGLAGMLDRGLWLERVATGEQVLVDGGERAPPMWFCHGDDDQINLYDATRRFAEVIDVGDKTFKRYKGGYHRLHAEPDGMKDQFAADVAEWILGKCPAWRNTSSGRTGSTDGKGDGGLVQGEGDSNIKSPAEDDNAGTRADWTQGMKEVVKPKL